MNLALNFRKRERRTTRAAALIAVQLNTLYYGCIVIIVMAILSSLSIAALVIGLTRQSECPIQAWIPRWLIIFGGVGLGGCVLFIIMAILKMCCCYSEERCEMESCFGLGFCFLILLLGFFFAWMIAGSVWVFAVRSRVQFDRPSEGNYCQKLLYNMAFGCILGHYGVIGLILCLVACFFVIIKLCD